MQASVRKRAGPPVILTLLKEEDQLPCPLPGKEVTGLPKEEPGPQSQPVLGPARGAVAWSS